jgi:hypothetical protein
MKIGFKDPQSKIVVLCTVVALSWISSRAGAQGDVVMPALASYDWSVRSPHSLASNPPPAEVVQEFANAAFGPDFVRVCDFQFADLRQAGNLSLVASIDAGGTGGCNRTELFDKTPSGFQVYSFNSTWLAAGGIQDINADGKFEMVLWAPLLPSELQGQCYANEPLIFAWTGTEYKEVSKQYPRFYQRRLKSLNKQLAAISTASESGQKTSPVASEYSIPQSTALPQAPPSPPPVTSPGFVPGVVAGGPVYMEMERPSIEPAPERPANYDCLMAEAAQTEALLGEHSDAIMSYAITDSESNDPYHREIAAKIFAFIGTREALSDLKGLGSDSDRSVKELAQGFLSSADDNSYYTQILEEPVKWLPRDKK